MLDLKTLQSLGALDGLQAGSRGVSRRREPVVVAVSETHRQDDVLLVIRREMQPGE